MIIDLLRRSSVCFMLLCVLVVHAQNKHERYIQQLPGTRLQFSMEAIPGGEFVMGSKGDAPADEKPAHRTQISPFWMSTFEVTWDLFEPFVYKDFEVANATEDKIDPKVDAVTRPTKPYLDMTFGMGKQGHPALAMTHYNAIQFCKWLYMRTGEFYRLPTEAEWEYACRAGSVSDYHFGDDATNLEDYGWYSENSDGETSAVGKKKPNAWGLFDMLGNVAEWTYDQYQEDYYQQFDGQLAENPISEPTALYPHSVRGGSFESKANELRSAARMASDPIWKQLDPQIPKSNWWFPEAPFVGMRLVRPVLKPSHEQIMAYYDKAPIKDF